MSCFSLIVQVFASKKCINGGQFFVISLLVICRYFLCQIMACKVSYSCSPCMYCPSSCKGKLFMGSNPVATICKLLVMSLGLLSCVK